MNDPLDQQDNHARTYSINGIELNPYSFIHRLAHFRLDIESGVISELESATQLLYLLTLDARQADKVRGEAMTDFRVKAAAWAEVNFRDRIAAIELHKQILKDVSEAASIAPDGKSQGNE